VIQSSINSGSDKPK